MDLSKLSDDELKAMYSKQATSPAAPSLSSMSDDQLRAAYAAAKPSQSSRPDIGPEIGNGVVGALKSAGSAVSDYLNPFSEARHASYAKQAAAPIGKALTENLKQIGGVGAAMATPVTAPGAVVGAVAEPLIAHPYHALNNALGTDISYPTAKEQVATALMGLAPKGYSPAGARMVPPATPTAAELKMNAKSVYNDPAIKTAPIPATDVSNLASKLSGDLTYQGFRPTNGSAPGTFAEIERLTPPAGASPTVDDMRAARRALNMTAAQKDQFGKPTPDAVAASQSIRQIDNLLDGVAPELKSANADYAAAKQAEQLDYRAIKAEHRAAKSGSGSNIENTMRQEVDKIPDRGLTAEERAMRDKIVEGDFTRNALRKVGKLGFSDGLSLILHAGAAVPTAGASTALGVGATAARKVGEMLTRRQISQLSEMIRSRAPSSQNALPQPAQLSQKERIIAAIMAGRGGGLPVLPGVVPSYADQNQ